MHPERRGLGCAGKGAASAAGAERHPLACTTRPCDRLNRYWEVILLGVPGIELILICLHVRCLVVF